MTDDRLSRPLASRAAIVALIVTSFAVARYSLPKRTVSPSDLWADAIVSSFNPGDDAVAETHKRFAKAISVSDNPDHVYVSLGDYLRGPVPLWHTWNKAFGDDQELMAAAANEALRGAGTNRVLSFLNGDNGAAQAYVAAIAISPTSRLAHFRVSVFGEKTVALRSARWLAKNEPRNALGLYLEAALVADDDRERFFKLMSDAVGRPNLELPDEVLPEPTNTVYPPSFEKFAGLPVTKAGLKFLGHRHNQLVSFVDPFRDSVERLLAELLEIADDRGHPRSDSAAIIHQQVCHQLVFNESGNLFLATTGELRRRDSYQLLLNRLSAEQRRILHCESMNGQIKRFGELMSEGGWPTLTKMRKTSLDEILSGKFDAVAAETDVVRRFQALAREP
ncbi:MAG: hypothetical protein Fues2KO_08320 [Fuerstiella sp.]